MKKLIILGVLVAAIMSMTGCGSKIKTSKTGVTIETPESGWKVQQDDGENYILTKDSDSIMYMAGNSQGIKVPSTKEEVQTQMGEKSKILDFSYENEGNNKKLFYVASVSGENIGSTTVIINKTVVQGDNYTTIVGTALTPSDKRIEDMKNTINGIERKN